MRVDLVITELRTGGAERCLTELALGLQARGDWVRVFSLGPLPSTHRGELVRRLFQAGIPVYSADAKGWFSYPRVVRTLRNWLKEDPPDLIQTFLFHANVIGAAAAAQAEVPCRVGGVRVAEANRFRVYLERRATTRMQRVICVSESVASFVHANWEVSPRERVITIPNGVSPERFQHVTPFDFGHHGLAAGSLNLLFMGRFHQQKGVDLLMDVLPDVWLQFPDLRCIFVGEGPYQRRVQRFVARAPEGFAICLPWQSAVEPLYSAADLVIVPSRFEGMPNVILESMAAGRSVLAADVEGVAELLGPHAAPQMFNRGDRDSLVAGIQRLVSSDLRAELGLANRTRAAAEFTLDRMVDRYRAEYVKLVNESSL